MSHSSKKPQLKWYEKASKKMFSQDEDGADGQTNGGKQKNRSDRANVSTAEKPSGGRANGRSDRANVSAAEKSSGGKANGRADRVNVSAAEKLSGGKSNGRSDRTNFCTQEKIFCEKKNYIFDNSKVPSDAKSVLADFDKVVSSTHPLSSRQRSLLPKQINELSHQLTDDRTSRRLGYMNTTTTVTAYVYYYMWWNLVRLTRLFASLPEDAFDLKDGDFCVDAGSGPLTVVIALLLARPELRQKKLNWYCLDLSQVSMSFGHDIFLSICARLQCEPWNIIRVKGELGTSLKQKAKFVTCANVFNEIGQDSKITPEEFAKKSRDRLLSYIDSASGQDKSSPAVLVVEPGVPSTARFVSTLRASFMHRNYMPVSPCTHCGQCALGGLKNTGSGKTGKWCNFSFTTEEAPAALKKLSESAGIPKERAVLSYFFSKYTPEQKNETEADELSEGRKNSGKNRITVRVASDVIRLPGNRCGYYACSEKGLLLLQTSRHMCSGESYEIDFSSGEKDIDEKSGAIVVRV